MPFSPPGSRHLKGRNWVCLVCSWAPGPGVDWRRVWKATEGQSGAWESGGTVTPAEGHACWSLEVRPLEQGASVTRPLLSLSPWQAACSDLEEEAACLGATGSGLGSEDGVRQRTASSGTDWCDFGAELVREPLSPVPCGALERGAQAAGVTSAASRGAPHGSQREALIIRASTLGLCSDPGPTAKANRLSTVSPQLQLGGACAFPLAFRWETAGLRTELWKLRTSSGVSDG